MALDIINKDWALLKVRNKVLETGANLLLRLICQILYKTDGTT